jgi:hypothetical protein
MIAPGSPNQAYIPLLPLGAEGSTAQALVNPQKRVMRNRGIVKIVSFPLILLLLYSLAVLWPKSPTLFDHPESLSHGGKSALATTITLPRLQYNFEKNEGGHDERRRKVKESIRRTWDLYTEQAWGWDEVRPVRGGGRNTRSISLWKVH